MFQIDPIQIHGQDIIDKLARVNALSNAVNRGITQGWYTFGHYLVRKAQDSIKNDQKTGRIYKLHGGLAIKAGKVFHQASAPGESPANLTGKLAEGVHYQVTGDGMDWGYSASTPYGKYLEYGAKGPGKRKLLKRPNIIPISQKSEVTAGIMFNETISSEISKCF